LPANSSTARPSCGAASATPVSERARRKGPDGVAACRSEKNGVSINSLPTGVITEYPSHLPKKTMTR
jgi:hypothetical protein